MGNAQAFDELRHLHMKIFVLQALQVDSFVVLAVMGLESSNSKPYASE